MSADPPRASKRPAVPGDPGTRTVGPIAEPDRVTLGRDVLGDEGEPIPAGSSGTVVAIWAKGAAYEVEFARPVSALATVTADAISAHHPRRSR